MKVVRDPYRGLHGSRGTKTRRSEVGDGGHWDESPVKVPPVTPVVVRPKS